MNQPIKKQVWVACTIERAFEVFTQQVHSWWPASHRRFEGSRMIIESHVGGAFFEQTDAGEKAQHGTILRWEPPSRLTYTWVPGSEVGPTEVDVRFSADGPRTLVQITHSEGESGLGSVWPERAKRFDQSWSEVLPEFEAVFLNTSEE